MRKIVGGLLVFLSVFYVASFGVVTGGVIGSLRVFNFFSLVFLAMFFIGIFLMVSGGTFDAIVVPTGDLGSDVLRAGKAADMYRRGKTGRIVISGARHPDAVLGKPQVDRIYDILRKGDVREEDISGKGGDGARNTIENVVKGYENLRGMKRVGVATYREHFTRFKMALDHAKKEGLIDKNLKIYRVDTPTRKFDKVYAMVADWKMRDDLSEGLEHQLKHPKEHPYLDFMKEKVLPRVKGLFGKG